MTYIPALINHFQCLRSFSCKNHHTNTNIQILSSSPHRTNSLSTAKPTSKYPTTTHSFSKYTSSKARYLADLLTNLQVRAKHHQPKQWETRHIQAARCKPSRRRGKAALFMPSRRLGRVANSKKRLGRVARSCNVLIRVSCVHLAESGGSFPCGS
jgi:hypothetical protein